ncbi:hypothetical protein SAMN05444422_10632 [Halobiforma haloterrestris]|uniref:Hsp20/alpha crystallin family protein n=1 Tax=Natronobacterium haloterrestre TaxID=148448 RepID=A0A1I1HQV2_NATHA|nr:hypothetical protein SAMN05444422_10632 [Halobiforma haloterrestris]
MWQDVAGRRLTIHWSLEPDVNVPEPLRNAEGDDALVRSFEYDDTDESLIAVDFGRDRATGDELSVDVVDSRVIVVADDQGLECEFDLPPSATDVSVRNGVVTIAGEPDG